MWTYEQLTGQLLHDDEVVATGYSGHAEGKNNPEMQRVHSVGPIPCGLYKIGRPYDTQSHGPLVLPLEPLPPTNTFGRGGFLIHGDSKSAPGTASLGCIIMGRAIREQVAHSGEKLLQVTSGMVVSDPELGQ